MHHIGGLVNPYTAPPLTPEINASLLVDLGAGAPVTLATLNGTEGHELATVHWDDVPLAIKAQLASALHEAADRLDSLA